jgi:Ca2+-binding EF-hand superfamily protein
MVMAMFGGPCEYDMGDIELHMETNGTWTSIEGLSGNETLGIMMSNEMGDMEDMEDMEDMDIAWMLMDEIGMEIDAGNHSMRYVFDDLEVGINYSVFLDSLMDVEEDYLYFNECNIDDDEYWTCEVDNDGDGISDESVELDWCYELEEDWYECENDDDDIIFQFIATAETQEYEWTLDVEDSDCGFVFVVGLIAPMTTNEDVPIALSAYAFEGPAIESCSNDDDENGLSPELLMEFADMDEDNHLSWDEFMDFMDDNYGQEIDNNTSSYWYVMFEDSDESGDGLLNMDELNEFLNRLNNDDSGNNEFGIEDLMTLADEDEDNHLSWDEFMDFMDDNYDGQEIDDNTMNYWYDMFEDSDESGDGLLNMDELNEFWNLINDVETSPEEMMEMLDADGDSNANWEEIQNFWNLSDDMNDIFNDSDMNGDGLLDLDELMDFMDRLSNSDDTGNNDWNLFDYIFEQHWTVSLGYTDDVNFTYYLSVSQILNDSLTYDADMMFGNGDGELNSTEAEGLYNGIMNSLDPNPSAPNNITLNGIDAEIIFVGYDIVDLVSGSPQLPAIITMWDLVFHDVTANDDGNYEFAYTEDSGVQGIDVPAEFCTISYEYSYEIIGFVWNGSGYELDCVTLDAGQAVPSFSITYGQEVNNDYDNDGVDNEDDAFPYNPSETADTDGDGWGDNEDEFPNDADEWIDTDGDGVGDNSDEDYDGDGTPNDVDDFPLASSSNDADNDGVENDIDAFPNNPNEYFDTDGDGVGDNADLDDDGDGYADSVDAFPNDPSEHLDTDGDGLGDVADDFPNDASERKDSDGDGVGDNSDAFPSEFNEWSDSDGDGVGDNSDAFPNDASEIVDSDGDGVGNNGDAFPYNANEQKDSDNNGVGDNAQAEQEGGTDPVEPEPVDTDDGGFLPGFSSTMGIISMLGAAILVAGRRKD